MGRNLAMIPDCLTTHVTFLCHNINMNQKIYNIRNIKATKAKLTTNYLLKKLSLKKFSRCTPPQVFSKRFFLPKQILIKKSQSNVPFWKIKLFLPVGWNQNRIKLGCANTAQKMKFSIKDFFRKCDQIRRKLRIWLYLLKKSLMEN